MAYGNFKDLNRRTAVDKVLHDKAMMGISVELLQWFIIFL